MKGGETFRILEEINILNKKNENTFREKQKKKKKGLHAKKKIIIKDTKTIGFRSLLLTGDFVLTTELND